MSVAIKKKDIGGKPYWVTTMGVETALTWQPVLFEAAGEALGALVRAGNVRELSPGALLGVAGPAVAAMMRAVGNSRFKELVDALAEHTEVILPDGRGQPERKALTRALQDQLWVGSWNHFLSWFVFSLEVNFGSFFSGMLGERGGIDGALAELKEKLSSKSASPAGSTGSSGESPAPPT